MSSLVKNGRAVASPHMGEVVGHRYFTFLIFSSRAHIADAGRSTPRYYISVDAVWPKDVLLGVSTQKKFILGVNPKTPSIPGKNRDFKLKY